MQNLHSAFRGLTSAEVLAQRRQYGENALPSPKRSSTWAIFVNQFKNPLIYIILAAAGISLAAVEIGKAIANRSPRSTVIQAAQHSHKPSGGA